MAKVPKIRPRTKHLNIKYHHFHQHVQPGLLSVGFHPFMLRCYFTRYATIYSTLRITQLMSYLTLCYAHVPHTYDTYRTAYVVSQHNLCRA